MPLLSRRSSSHILPILKRTFTVILANEAQSPSLGTRTRHWGNYKGLNRFRVFEEMRAEINTLKETTAVQDPNFHLKKLSLQDWASISGSWIRSEFEILLFLRNKFSNTFEVEFYCAGLRSCCDSIGALGRDSLWVLRCVSKVPSSRTKSEPKGDAFPPGFAMASIRSNDSQPVEHARPQKLGFNLFLSFFSHIWSSWFLNTGAWLFVILNPVYRQYTTFRLWQTRLTNTLYEVSSLHLCLRPLFLPCGPWTPFFFPFCFASPSALFRYATGLWALCPPDLSYS